MRFAISANSAVVNRQIEVGVSKMEMTSDKFFISLDISVLGHEKSCLEVFEIRKKSLHLQPQTIKTMRYSMNIISLEPKVSTGWILGCRVRYAHCSGN